MEIKYSKQFKKAFFRLSAKNRVRVKKAIRTFREDPFSPSLRNHTLFGKLKGLRSLSAGYDLRIIFKAHDGYIVVVLINVGTHKQIY
ncbi:type II toxin-antitoxin system RelE/ParE family toxin [Magnetococcales bacterium HHB-1]